MVVGMIILKNGKVLSICFCLLVVVIYGVKYNSNNKQTSNDEQVNTKANDYFINDINNNDLDHIENEKKSASIFSEPKSAEKPIDTINEPTSCSSQCQQSILTKLWNGDNLTAEDVKGIEEAPKFFALLLRDKPDEMSSLMMTFSHDEENENADTQKVAYLIYSALSTHEKAEIATNLAERGSVNERSAALKLFGPALSDESINIDAFNHILEEEIDLRILEKAINLSSRVSGLENSARTLQALTTVIENDHSEHTSGMALLAKSKLALSPTDVREDILDAINSYSSDKKEFGLLAIETTLQRHKENLEYSDSFDFQSSIETIVNDPQVASNIKDTAQRLLDEYF